ncbi:protein cramped isoform X1 [Chironomus tepperi]|uniref:protein cramped isoform X1 n=1 Tax=Chironomus tepperi TaxID=113505 RepID=UPI00391F8B91
MEMKMNSNELLGSVTQDSVRTSARVIQSKIMRMDPVITTQTEKKEEKPNEINTVNQPKTPSQSKHIRIQWTMKEKKCFFDALNEHGRDFEQISRFINLKMKRKNPTESDYKTKEHVRQHYYQLFQKASKYLKFSDDVKKLAQELYVLINYGEMKKKLIMSSDKSFLKLRDLVYRGSVTVRVKGKNIKIKTPSCRALKKLNQLEGNNIEDIQLPQRIDVIVRPSNQESWAYVQRLAQNPRIKVSLPLQKRISCLLQTLEQKWRPQDVRLHEKYVVKIIQQNSRQKLSDEIIAQSEEDAKFLKGKEPRLYFYPPENCKIFRPMIQLNEFLSSYSLCLNSYEVRIGARKRGEEICMEKNSHLKDISKNSAKRIRNDSFSEKINAVSDARKMKPDEQNVDDLGIIYEHKSNDSNDLNEIKKRDGSNVIKVSDISNEIEKPEAVIDEKKDSPDIETNKALSTKNENCNVVSTKPNKKSMLCASKNPKEYSFKPLINEDTIKKIRQGWNVENASDLTIGDLYLMYGSDSKLFIEYKWHDPENSSNTSNGISSSEQIKVEPNNIGSKLKHLMMVASLIEKPNGVAMLNNRNLEKNLVDTKEFGESSNTFKTPSFDTFMRPNMNPRLKPHQSKWWRNQHYRYRPDSINGNYFKNNNNNHNHVVRNLYQTPTTQLNDLQKSTTDEESRSSPVDEVTKILEDKIQFMSSKQSQVQNFSESSRSSIKSLLETLSGSSNRTNYDYADLRFWDHENERVSEDFDNISLSSLLGHLDSFYGNKSQGATDTDENL